LRTHTIEMAQVTRVNKASVAIIARTAFFSLHPPQSRDEADRRDNGERNETHQNAEAKNRETIQSISFLSESTRVYIVSWSRQSCLERTGCETCLSTVLGGQLKPAICGHGKTGHSSAGDRDAEFYFVMSSVRKAGCTFVRQLRRTF